MKKATTLLMAAVLTLSCDAQEKDSADTLKKEDKQTVAGQPKGEWKVNKEFDEAGNLIRYDSIYSWSSGNDLDELSLLDRDSTLRSLRSRFYREFSRIDEQEFGDLFSADSIFSKRFFNDDFFDSEFGRDFMDIDRIRERMERLQQEFLEKYQSEYEKDSIGQQDQ